MRQLASAASALLFVCGAVACGSSGGSASSSASSGRALPAGTGSTTATPPPAVATKLPIGVLASIALPQGGAPASVAAGFGSIWVATHRGTVLYRIDESTDKVTAQIDVGQESCGVMAVGDDRVWTLPCASGATIVVNPVTNQIERTLPPAAVTIAFVNGRPLLTSRTHGWLTELDPVTFRVIATVKIANSMISAGEGKIFIANPSPVTGAWGDAIISEIDPSTHTVMRSLTTPDPGCYASMIFVFGRVWLKGCDSNRLIAIDPATNRTSVYPLAGWSALDQLYGEDLTTGLGSLWVRTANGVVSRLDPANGKLLATYPADPAAGGGDIVVDHGSLWIANFGTDTVWRDRITP